MTNYVYSDHPFCHPERSEESSELSELISESKSIPLFTSPLIRGKHSNPSLSREGFGMGFVQKNGAVNSINRSRIKCGMTNFRHPELVSVCRSALLCRQCKANLVKCGDCLTGIYPPLPDVIPPHPFF